MSKLALVLDIPTTLHHTTTLEKLCSIRKKEKRKKIFSWFVWTSHFWTIHLIDCNSHHIPRRVDLDATTFYSGWFWRIDSSALTVDVKNLLKMPPVCLLCQVPSRLRSPLVSSLWEVKFGLKVAVVIKHRNTV